MDRQYLDAPESVTPDPQDALMRVLARRGGEHERSFLARLRDSGCEVREISREAGVQGTRSALEAGVSVIYQAALQGNGFAGYADFLIRAQASAAQFDYAVWDTKLARQAKPYFILQMCCYADMLEAMTGQRPTRIGVILGNGDEHSFRTSDFFHYYQRIRGAFLGLMARFPGGGMPAPEPNVNHGLWAGEASRWLVARDDLSQVANISRGQIAKLTAAGVETLTALASRKPGRVRGIGDEVVGRLHRQAGLQVRSRGKVPPEYLLLPPPAENPDQGLAAIPPATAGDIYFDMEGYPAADEWLEYLFGVVTIEAGKPAFLDWWAHDAQQERQAFESFIDWVWVRWLKNPKIHIYHYAAYEPVALKRLMSKYGSREDEVDALLRAGVFIDLFSVVRRGVMVGEPAYSLKNIEHLYRPVRSGDVTDAGASVAVYDEWCESGEGRDWRQSPLLKSIRDYNEDDCVSTWQLAEWLRARQTETGVSYVRSGGAKAAEIPEQPLSDAHEARRRLAQQLMATLPPENSSDPAATERRRIQQLLGWLVEFHRREDKPMWWQYYARQEMTVAELWDDLDCLAGLRLMGAPEAAKRSYLFHYQFDPDQDSKLHEGKSISFVPHLGFQAEIDSFDPEGSLSIKVSGQKLAKAGLSSLPAQTSLIPYDFVNPKPIPESIASTAEKYLNDGSLPPALADFLARRLPRLKTAQAGRLRLNGEATVDAAIRLARDLEQSCLCLQGPPAPGRPTRPPK
jgi:predicted RecB family nuclease